MIKILPSKLNGTINAPASKDHAQRLLFMSALSDYKTLITNVPDCDDITTTLDCLRALGCNISVNGSSVEVDPFPRNTPIPTADFDFKDSSTCCHIAFALSAALGIKASCVGSSNLQKRRMYSLTSRMAIRGVKFTNFSIPCEISGKLEGGDYILEGEDLAASACALLIALPLLRDDSTIRFASPLIDSSLVELTLNCLSLFEITVERKEDGSFFIPGKQFYKSPGKLNVENDWGLSSMWITAAAACGDDNLTVTVNNLPANSTQKYNDIQGIITLLHFNFMSINIDASECPDLATLFAATGIVKGATMEIIGVPQLRFYETNRLKTMAAIANQLGQDAKVSEDGGSITLIGNENPDYKENIIIDCKDDPWIFMSMVLASATMKIPYILSNEHGADKIYKKFLSDFSSLGGQYEII